MAKPNMFVNSVAQQDELVIVGTIMEHNDPPALLVMVTGVNSDGSFAGVQLDKGIHLDEWEPKEFHIFRGEVTLSQGY